MQRPEGFQSSQCGLHGALPERHTRAAIPCRSSVTLRRCCVRHDPGTGRSRSESPPEAGPRCNRTFCRCRTGRIVISESRPRTVLAHYANLKHDGALPCIQIFDHLLLLATSQQRSNKFERVRSPRLRWCLDRPFGRLKEPHF